MAVRAAGSQLSPQRVAQAYQVGKRLLAARVEQVGRRGARPLRAPWQLTYISSQRRKPGVRRTGYAHAQNPWRRAHAQAAVEPLAPKVDAAFIYGSVAKGTDKAKSDIDVMLVGKNLTLSKVLELVVPLEAQLGRKINPTLLTSAEFKRRRADRDSFVNRVLAQPTIPLIGDVPGPGRAR